MPDQEQVKFDLIPAGGIELQFSTDERNLWWDNDESYIKEHSKTGFGIFLALRWGRLLRPIPKIWQWKGLKPNWKNPWQSGDHWFVLNIPIIVFPFISIAVMNVGMYLGAKWYDVNNPGYKKWIPHDYWITPQSDETRHAVAISGSIRKTRIV